MKALLLPVFLLAATPACAATWSVQPSASTLGFSGTQTGSPFTGTFKQWTAEIAYDPAHPEAAHVHIVVNTGSAHTGDTQRDEAMPGADWFSAAAFPQAVFDATGFTPAGSNHFTTTGTLTIRGISHKLTLPFTLDVAGSQATAEGEIALNRGDYGVGQGNWASGDWVGLPVEVKFVLAAKTTP
ncbi:MAG TPA: YceI family protein [Acidocella sp.]|nr:YceI family protein [Acidocella sp.]